jgi:Fe-S oxidoreductase
MKYPPHKMIAALRAGMFEMIVESDSTWLCMSCQACAEVCPAGIPLTGGLMTMAKEEMVLAGNTPTELQDALEKTQRYGNSLGESPRRRAEWTEGLEPPVPLMRKADRGVEVLWFVGDYASYHPRVQRSTRAMARLLGVLGVDFGILGPEENSDADSQRLAGERGLFEMQAEKNAAVLEKYDFDEIVTTDPHAYNALKNEYPRLGFSYPVRHYTEFLAGRLDELTSLLTHEVAAQIAYHDPCYLGRANGIYEEPRLLLRSIPGAALVEMAHIREFSLCCGGGGGGMWLDGFMWDKGKVRPADWRVREAVGVGADILAVACPPEAPRFEDAAKTVEGAEQLVVKDIAELLVESIDGGEVTA